MCLWGRATTGPGYRASRQFDATITIDRTHVANLHIIKPTLHKLRFDTKHDYLSYIWYLSRSVGRQPELHKPRAIGLKPSMTTLALMIPKYVSRS
jgi:hypothetical protein